MTPAWCAAREAYANRERFPEAQQVIAEDFDKAVSQLAPSESSYIVIVTRGHRDDMRMLRWAVQTPARYVGMIGSKRKTITIFKELQQEGLPAHLFDRVHAPVGLDIGAITPEEIAVSITAELIAKRRKVERDLPHMSWFHRRELKSLRSSPSLSSRGDGRPREPVLSEGEGSRPSVSSAAVCRCKHLWILFLRVFGVSAVMISGCREKSKSNFGLIISPR